MTIWQYLTWIAVKQLQFLQWIFNFPLDNYGTTFIQFLIPMLLLFLLLKYLIGLRDDISFSYKVGNSSKNGLGGK